MSNSCGVITMIQNCLKHKNIKKANKKADRKKALEMLDEEI